MRALLSATALGIFLASGCFSSVSATPAPTPVTTPAPYSYADIADLATIAPMAIKAQIYSSSVLKAEQAPGLKAGQARFYVEADVVALIRGSGPLAARIGYLVDLPLDARGKPAKLKKKQPVLLFARPVAGVRPGANSTGSVQLVAPDAQLPWDPATEAQLRAILTELVKPGAPPAVTGVANGFHVPGGCARRSAITHKAGAWKPRPIWVVVTSIFSRSPPSCSRQARHATTPSARV